MSREQTAPETTVTDRGMVTVPAAVRQELGIEPGDKLRWSTNADGELRVELLPQREGVFDEFEPVDAGETDAVALKDEFGAE